MVHRARLILLMAYLLAAGTPSNTIAHGGGLDSLGCHYNRKSAGFHCHQGPLAGQEFGSKAEALEAVKAMQGGSRTQAPVVSLTPTAIVGRASVIDGDTIEIHDTRIRFHGIDAPESSQTCLDGLGREYRCGQRAALTLADKIGQRTVSCDQKDVDRYGRIVAICWVGSENVNAWLVLAGWAVAYRRFATDYVPMEDEAKAAKRGLWAGVFIEPEEWRRQKRQ